MAVRTNNGWTVEVTGLRELIDALNALDVKASRALTKTIGDAGKGVAADAAGRVSQPLSNWGGWRTPVTGGGAGGQRDLAFKPSRVAAGFKLTRSNFRRRGTGISAGAGWDVYQTDAAGAIFEVIGDKSRVSDARGAQFVDSIVSRFPRRQPRTLFPAYYAVMTDELRDSIRDQVLAEAKRVGLV